MEFNNGKKGQIDYETQTDPESNILMNAFVKINGNETRNISLPIRHKGHGHESNIELAYQVIEPLVNDYLE